MINGTIFCDYGNLTLQAARSFSRYGNLVLQVAESFPCYGNLALQVAGSFPRYGDLVLQVAGSFPRNEIFTVAAGLFHHDRETLYGVLSINSNK